MRAFLLLLFLFSLSFFRSVFSMSKCGRLTLSWAPVPRLYQRCMLFLVLTVRPTKSGDKTAPMTNIGLHWKEFLQPRQA
ncbi:hypothetical protein F5X99DRAFT_388091 [Biscogniauxia marginata]|nr:hypothetical protein F5X99DRAFT_388091 [Biscogniauxia marginata]